MTKTDSYGSWEVDLGGISYRELWELGQMLEQLGDKGNLFGKDYDLDTLKAGFNARTGDVFLFDDNNTTLEEEDE